MNSTASCGTSWKRWWRRTPAARTDTSGCWNASSPAGVNPPRRRSARRGGGRGRTGKREQRKTAARMQKRRAGRTLRGGTCLNVGGLEVKTFTNWPVLVLTLRLKGLLDKDDQESEVIKDSPDSPEPLNKKPRVSTEEDHPPERAKGSNLDTVLRFKRNSTSSPSTEILRRSRLAPHHVDQPHHRRQFQEAPGVCRTGELCQQQVWAVPAAEGREWVCEPRRALLSQTSRWPI